MDIKAESYPTKVDAWLVAVIVAVLLGMLIFVGYISWQSGDLRPLIYVIICEIITSGLMLLIGYPVRYLLSPEQLIVKSGVMRVEVPVHKITKVEKTRSLLSAPAWSIDRVKVDYDNNGYPAYVIISPKDRDRFIQQLESFMEHRPLA